MDGYAAPLPAGGTPAAYMDDGLGYADDGLGGLGGDGLLGGLGGQPAYTAQPAAVGAQAEPMFTDDGLPLGPPLDEPSAAEDAGVDADAELGEALDEAFGLEPSQAGTTSAHDSGRGGGGLLGGSSLDDEATEDELDDGASAGGAEQAAGVAGAQAEPAQDDPAAAEAQRQNVRYKECFDAMTEVQRNRLEAYIRSNLQKKTMKKVLQELTGVALNDRLVIAISSITKMFVGELVEAARQIAARQGHTGALLPTHIRQAYNALSADGRVPHRAPSRPLRLC